MPEERRDKELILEDLINWQADPYDNRTVAQFLEQHKLPKPTFYYYKNKNRDFINEEVAKRRKRYFAEMKAHAYKALAKRLEKSDKALQMFFEMSGEYVPKSEQKIEYLTPEQKREKLKSMLEALSGKLGPEQAPGEPGQPK